MNYLKHFTMYVDKYVASIRERKRGNADIDRLRVKLIQLAVDRISSCYVEELLHIAESRSIDLCVDQKASIAEKITPQGVGEGAVPEAAARMDERAESSPREPRAGVRPASAEQPYVWIVYRIEEHYLEKLPGELATHVYEDDSRWRQSPWDLLIKIKEVFMEEEHARAEVERLNILNADKDCRYFWQGAKFYPEGRKAQQS